MRKAALYIRVSTDKQEELSPDAQKRLLYEYAAKNDIEICEDYIFLEGGISGKKVDKRPQFQKMIGLAKSNDHVFDVILIWKFSRFARNQEESIVYKSLLKKNNIDVVSISEPIIEGPFGSLIERIIEWMDEYYSIRLSGEVVRGMTEKALRGGYQSMAPLGYTKGNPPTIIPEEAEIVNLVFDKYLNEGLTVFEIARLLNEMGLKTRQDNLFERRTIEYILENPFYTGHIRWFRQNHENHTVRDKSEWIVKKAKHEPIISEDVFRQVQERMRLDRRPLKSRPVTEYRHWLSGIIKCGYCGKPLVASKTKNPNRYNFQCSGYGKGKCESNGVSSNNIVPEILKAFKRIVESGDIDYSVHDHNDNKLSTTLLEQQLSKLDVKSERIKAAYINGVDTLEEYKANKNAIVDERNLLIKQIKDINKIATKNHKPEMLKRVNKVYNILMDDNADMLVKNRAIRSVCEKITYNKREGLIDIYFYYI
jgi:DNA invertase Pin-like site-specific DNA recombinase